jgi:hypothetical protein
LLLAVALTLRRTIRTSASLAQVNGQSALRLPSKNGLKLPPGPAKHVEIDGALDPDTRAGVVKLPDHPLGRSERGRPKQAAQPKPLAY